jgi:hypothetical protein
MEREQECGKVNVNGWAYLPAMVILESRFSPAVNDNSRHQNREKVAVIRE